MKAGRRNSEPPYFTLTVLSSKWVFIMNWIRRKFFDVWYKHQIGWIGELTKKQKSIWLFYLFGGNVLTWCVNFFCSMWSLYFEFNFLCLKDLQTVLNQHEYEQFHLDVDCIMQYSLYLEIAHFAWNNTLLIH